MNDHVGLARETRATDETGADAELNQTEWAVLVALAAGRSVGEIAAALRMPEEMLEILMANVLIKLHRRHAARSALWGGPDGGPRPPLRR